MSTSKHSQTLLEETRVFPRRQQYSIHTECAYCDWIVRFVKFHHLREREALLADPEKKVEDFLTHLARHAKIAAATQNQAFNALVFLYKHTLKRPLEGVAVARSRKAPRNRSLPRYFWSDGPIFSSTSSGNGSWIAGA